MATVGSSNEQDETDVSSVPMREDAPVTGASSIPRHSGEFALAAVVAALLTSVYALWTGNVVRAAALREVVHGAWLETAIWLVTLAVLALFFPAAKAVSHWQSKNRALASSDIVGARIGAAAAKNWAFIALGYAAAGLLALAFVNFVFTNDMAVGRTFFYLPLIAEKYHLVVYAFWNNIFIFVIAEILV